MLLCVTPTCYTYFGSSYKGDSFPFSIDEQRTGYVTMTVIASRHVAVRHPTEPSKRANTTLTEPATPSTVSRTTNKRSFLQVLHLQQVHCTHLSSIAYRAQFCTMCERLVTNCKIEIWSFNLSLTWLHFMEQERSLPR